MSIRFIILILSLRLLIVSS